VHPVALVVQTNDEWQTYALRRTYFSVQPGQTVSFKFRLGDADQAGRFGLARQGGGFIGFIFHVGEMYPDYNLGTSRDWPIDGTAVDQRADVWYQANINVDSEGRVTWEVRPENPLSVNQSIFYMLNASSTNAFFKDQSFQFYLHSGTRAGSSTLYLRDYQEGGNRIVLCEGE
jgi:hypothetical protein